MANHPNRSGEHPSRNPTPQEVRAERLKAGLTQTAAAIKVHTTVRNWQQWEGGERRMHPAFWELFNIKVLNGGLTLGKQSETVSATTPRTTST